MTQPHVSDRMPRHGERCFIGRQPILDRDGHLFAYELLFRKGSARNEAVVDNPFRATASVIIDTVSSFGINDMLGGRKGFVNVDFDMLMSDAVELLPREQTVIELLETIGPEPVVVQRCRELKEAGFTLALDDHEYHPSFSDLYGIVDIVKIDLLQTPREQLAAVAARFSRFPCKLLAEKVEQRDVFEECRKAGFDYFQGYYFAKPSLLEKRKPSEDTATMFRLLRQLTEGAGIEEIDRTFRESASLTYRLLLLVNSVAFGTRQKIQSLRHAISMAGFQQIRRWLQLALFASEDDDGPDNPLVDMAATRACLLEHLARVHPALRHDRAAPDRAFMAGTLSLLERMFDLPIAGIVADLNLDSDLSDALVARMGVYGDLLLLVEHLETLEFDAARRKLHDLGISPDALFDSQVIAFNWKKGT